MPLKRIIHSAVWLALLPFVWLVSHFYWTCDDAFISFRYVKHLARGDGLIFNPGELPPVEGFTNLLWILLLAPFEMLGANLPLVANAISASCALALVVLLVQFLLRRGVSSWNATVCALIFVTLPPFAIWSTSGLETMAFSLAVFATYMALALGSGWSRILVAFICALGASLLRADGALWCGFAFIASLASHSTDGEHTRERIAGQWRAVLTTGALLTLGVAVHFYWRHATFGEWLPNTARIKAGFSLTRAERGLKYLASLVLAAPAIGLIPLMALPLIGRMRKHANFGVGAIGFLGLAALYTVFTGGDFMAMGRFLVPALPFLLLIFAAVVESSGKRGFVMCATSLLLCLGLLGCFDRLNFSPSVRQAVHFRWNREKARSEIEQWEFMGKEVVANSLLGKALDMHTLPGEKLIRGNVGAVGFYSELILLDLNGLVIPEVAAASKPVERASPGHDRRVDPSFFRTWSPDYQYAIILPTRTAPRLGFMDRWKTMLKRGRLELMRIPLRVEDGFEADTELRLLRDTRSVESPGQD